MRRADEGRERRRRHVEAVAVERGGGRGPGEGGRAPRGVHFDVPVESIDAPGLQAVGAGDGGVWGCGDGEGGPGGDADGFEGGVEG